MSFLIISFDQKCVFVIYFISSVLIFFSVVRAGITWNSWIKLCFQFVRKDMVHFFQLFFDARLC